MTGASESFYVGILRCLRKGLRELLFGAEPRSGVLTAAMKWPSVAATNDLPGTAHPSTGSGRTVLQGLTRRVTRQNPVRAELVEA